MMSFGTAQTYFMVTLPADIKIAARILYSKRHRMLIIFFGVLGVTIPISVLVMTAITGSLGNLVISDNYLTLAFQLIMNSPGKLLDTLILYLDYPAFWFTFDRNVDIATRQELLIMDTETSLSINIRYFANFAPIAALLAIYMTLSKYHASQMHTLPKKRNVTSFASISLPSGASAMGIASGPMACCSTTIAVTTLATGLTLAAPAVILFSNVTILAIAGLLITLIARTARKINSGCSCMPTR